MKKGLKRILIGILALAMSATMLTGCTDKNNSNNEDTTQTTVDPLIEAIEEQPEYATTRAVAEGDTYAIYKLIGDPADPYVLVASNDMGRAYMTEVSMIEVVGANYVEDYDPDIEVFAESACASIKYTNLLYQCDTDFEDAVHKNVDGCDAVYRDFLIVQNDFIKENEDDEDSEAVKTEVARHKGRAYFFYSEQDVYYILFQTVADNWDAQLPLFEEYMSSIKFDYNAKNPEKTEEAAQSGEIQHEDDGAGNGSIVVDEPAVENVEE